VARRAVCVLALWFAGTIAVSGQTSSLAQETKLSDDVAIRLDLNKDILGAGGLTTGVTPLGANIRVFLTPPQLRPTDPQPPRRELRDLDTKVWVLRRDGSAMEEIRRGDACTNRGCTQHFTFARTADIAEIVGVVVSAGGKLYVREVTWSK